MDTPTFNALKFGMIVAGPGGQTFIVQHTVKDSSGNTVAIGVMPAFEVENAAGLTMISSAYSRTVFEGAADGSIVLMGQTVPGGGSGPTASKK